MRRARPGWGRDGHLFFEDLDVGLCWDTDAHTVTEVELRAFASAYDPQSLHLDADRARQGPFGGLIASGFHTLALAWSLWVRLGIWGEQSHGGIGLDELRWWRPVRPGDTLRGRVGVIDRAAAARRGRGRVVLEHTVTNQRGETVLTFRTLCLVAARSDP